MEVIDDCFVAFFGAIFGAILPITSFDEYNAFCHELS
jgi:hypothetical protein